MGQSGYVHLDVLRIVKATEKAFLIEIEDAPRPLWVPKSACADADDFDEGDTRLTLSVREWWARENDIETD